MNELLLRQWITTQWWLGRLERVLAGRDERGEITEKTIIVSAFAIATLAISAMIIWKLTQTASRIITDPTTPAVPPPVGG